MYLSNFLSFLPWFPSLSHENHQETSKPNTPPTTTDLLNTKLEADKTLEQNPEETMTTSLSHQPPQNNLVLNPTIDEECCCRVQFKGLASEDIVGVKFWGIGVAICDAKKDSPIFKVSKPLNKNVGDGMSKRGAETLALIEGLNVALDLGLKKVTFLCHDFMLYQYVTGRRQSRQSKIAMLVSEVALLQSKFTYCNPSLVAQNNPKVAFKCARDAITSQITLPADTSSSKIFKETCVICFEETDVDQMFLVDGCQHRFCFSCMKQHVEVKLLHGMPGDAMLKSLAMKKLWCQYAQCKNMVELAGGCYHITCRCGYEFCYTCGAEWRNKKATCLSNMG